MKSKATKGETFADRFLRLKGNESFQSLSDRMAKGGLQMSPQGLQKWTVGGGVTPENLIAVARFFGESPAELFFGAEARARSEDLDPTIELIAQALTKIPLRFRKEIDRDILTLARAYTDQTSERALYDKLDRALHELDKK